MRVFQSAVLHGLPGIAHATAALAAQPLTFSGNSRSAVLRARRRFLRTVGATLDDTVLSHQVHGTRIRVVGEPDRGAGAKTPATYLAGTDGLLTQRPGIALGVFTADCVPVLLADPVTGWIGALHVGWRGAVKGVVPKALKMLSAQGVSLSDVRVWLGPAICGTHYTVDQTRARVLAAALGKPAVRKQHQGYAADLRGGLVAQLRAGGIVRSHIAVSTTCTYETRNLPSARRDGPTHANTLTAIIRHAPPLDLRGKRVVVHGLGVQGGGEAVVRYAVQQHATVTAIDAKPAVTFTGVRQRLRGLPVRFAFGQRSAAHLTGADVVIKNPGVPASHPALQRAKRHGAVVTSDIDLFRATSPNPVVAITGTKGKTTVATWLATLLRSKWRGTVLAGNVRHSPLLEPRAFDGHTLVVLELSSFQLEGLSQPLAPKLALVTNLFPDHLDRHRTMRAYAEVKSKVTAGQTAADFSIAPLDSDWRRFGATRTAARKFWTSAAPAAKANAFVENGWITLRLNGQRTRLVQVRKLKRQDTGTVRSAVSVALAAYLLGCSARAIRTGLLRFPGVAERFETVRTFRGRTFINNTTATNPAAAAAGIASVHGRCIVIAGGASKGLPDGELVRALNTAAAVVFLPGSATTALVPKVRVPKTRAASMAAAVRTAFRMSRAGDTIILSPGAASFGLFQNEFDRGTKFVAAVRSFR